MSVQNFYKTISCPENLLTAFEAKSHLYTREDLLQWAEHDPLWKNLLFTIKEMFKNKTKAILLKWPWAFQTLSIEKIRDFNFILGHQLGELLVQNNQGDK